MSSEERNLEDPETTPDCVPVNLDSLALNACEGEKDANDLGNESVEDGFGGAVVDVGANGGGEIVMVCDGSFVDGRHEGEDDGGGDIEEVGDGRLRDRHATGAGGWDEIEEVSDEKLGDGHRVNSEGDAERDSSASSSGYAAEREKGSSGSGRSSASDEIDDGGGAMAAWVAGKRHLDEDDASISWRKRKKHFFILSNSGKPIYSRYGDEHKLAGFSATLQAIISFVENGGDRIQSVRAGKHQVISLLHENSHSGSGWK